MTKNAAELPQSGGSYTRLKSGALKQTTQPAESPIVGKEEPVTSEPKPEES